MAGEDKGRFGRSSKGRPESQTGVGEVTEVRVRGESGADHETSHGMPDEDQARRPLIGARSGDAFGTGVRLPSFQGGDGGGGENPGIVRDGQPPVISELD